MTPGGSRPPLLEGPGGHRPPLLEGKVAIVAGAGPGVGAACARRLAGEGCAVAVLARRPEPLHALADEVTAAGGRALAVAADMLDHESCAAAATAVENAYGRIDVLVNVAYQPTDFTTFLEAEPDFSNWQAPFEMNVFGTLRMTRAVVPAMQRQGDGRVVMINSISSLGGFPREGSYSGSKAALAAMTRTLAAELGPFGIRVNGVHLSYIAGDRLDWWIEKQAKDKGISIEESAALLTDTLALRRFATPDEYAGTVVYLASDLSLPLTGQEIHLNAGRYFH